MKAPILMPILCGIAVAVVGGGLWFSVDPSSSEASTSPTASEPNTASSIDPSNSGPRLGASVSANSATDALDRAVRKVQGRFQSIQETSRIMSADAMRSPTDFRRLSLTVEDGLVTTKMEEVVAPLLEHRRFMEVSAFNAKRVLGDAMEGVGWLRRGVDGTSDSQAGFEAAVAATIEIAVITQLLSDADPASERRFERRVCELVEVVAPHMPPKRAKRVARALKRCASLDD